MDLPPLPDWDPAPDDAYGPRYADALALTAWGHRHQRRKRGPEERSVPGIPYVGHVLEVSALALLAGADEDQAVAALLHDALEDWDAPEERTAALIRDRYGERVLRLVEACTDRDLEGNRDRGRHNWRERKELHLRHLAELGPEELLVPAADKVANARAILDDLADDGVRVWQRFNAPAPDILWYYRANLAVLQEAVPDGLLTRRLADLVDLLAERMPGG
ncbi:MAG: HD domain-containing protein [Candidatus Nanopelagicales bacterium]